MRKRWFIWLPLLLLVVLLATMWVADSWLESPAGRARVESAVADALNMPVRLVGDFNISLWPAVGISGSKLEIGGSRMKVADGPGIDGPLLQCDSYHVSVALWPLLQGRILVLAVRASDGQIDPGRLGENRPDSPDSPPQPLRLPRVDFLQLENFQIPMTGDENLVLMLHGLVVEGFQVDRPTPLSLSLSIDRSSASMARVDMDTRFSLDGDASQLSVEISRLDLMVTGWEMKESTGSLNWNRNQGEIALKLEGQEPDFGRVSLAGSIDPGAMSGSLAVDVLPPDRELALTAGLSFRPMPGGIEMAGVRLESADQQVNGRGCLRTGAEPSLHLDLEASMIDLDRLQAWLPGDVGSSSGPGPMDLDLPLDLNIQLRVEELRSGKVVAHRVKVGAGGQPDCPAVPD